jgi:hypothetical protein
VHDALIPIEVDQRDVRNEIPTKNAKPKGKRGKHKKYKREGKIREAVVAVV